MDYYLPPPPPPAAAATSCASAASSDEAPEEERRYDTCARGLLHAAISGDLPLLTRMARQVEAVTRGKTGAGGVWSRCGHGALHLAAANGRTHACRFLLQDLGLPINALSSSSETPLLLAAMFGHTATAAYLVERGADASRPDGDGETPLHWAAYNGRSRVLVSVMHGCMHVRDTYLHTGDCELVKLLLAKGVDVGPANPRGTPLHVAAAAARPAAVSILLDHRADPNKLVNRVFTPLISSLLGGSLECTKLLIRAGANVNGSGVNGPTPLLLASCCAGFTSFIKCLLEAGANPNIPDEIGRLPIELAAVHAGQEAVEVLFRLTSRVLSTPDWSVDGIVRHVNSAGYKEQVKVASHKRKAYLKLQGGLAFRRKDYDAAILLYSMAIKFENTDATLYANRSLCWLHLGVADEALSDGQICCKMRPRWSKGYYRVGAAFHMLQDYTTAFDAFLKASMLDPRNAVVAEALQDAAERMNKS